MHDNSTVQLIFKCEKCKKKEIIKNPTKESQQPFCMACCRPMFIEKVKTK